MTEPLRNLTLQVPQVPARHEASIETPMGLGGFEHRRIGRSEADLPEIVNATCGGRGGGWGLGHRRLHRRLPLVRLFRGSEGLGPIRSFRDAQLKGGSPVRVHHGRRTAHMNAPLG